MDSAQKARAELLIAEFEKRQRMEKKRSQLVWWRFGWAAIQTIALLAGYVWLVSLQLPLWSDLIAVMVLAVAWGHIWREFDVSRLLRRR